MIYSLETQYNHCRDETSISQSLQPFFILSARGVSTDPPGRGCSLLKVQERPGLAMLEMLIELQAGC